MERAFYFGTGALASGLFAALMLYLMAHVFNYTDTQIMRALVVYIVVSGGMDMVRRCKEKY